MRRASETARDLDKDTGWEGEEKATEWEMGPRRAGAATGQFRRGLWSKAGRLNDRCHPPC